MATIPEHTSIETELLKALASFYEASIPKIEKRILIKVSEQATAVSKQEVLKQVRAELARLYAQIEKQTGQSINKQYLYGQKEFVKDYGKAGFPVPGSFSVINKEAVNALTDETVSSFAEAMSGAEKTARDYINSATKKKIIGRIATGEITGDTVSEVAGDIQKAIKDDGFNALVDRGGRRWELGSYSEMLTRTKMTEARNLGLHNAMRELGEDLVIVSSHSNPCQRCAPYQGKVFSLSGKHPNYQSLESVKNENNGYGLFHPNCAHVATAYFPSLKDTIAVYDGDNYHEIERKSPVKYDSGFKAPRETLTPFMLPSEPGDYTRSYFRDNFLIAANMADDYDWKIKFIHPTDIQEPIIADDKKVESILSALKAGKADLPPIHIVDNLEGEFSQKYVVFDGMHRLAAALKYGVNNIPVIYGKLK